MYFMHCLYVIIISFNTGLCKPTFSTDSFGKLVYVVLNFLSFLPVLCRI